MNTYEMWPDDGQGTIPQTLRIPKPWSKQWRIDLLSLLIHTEAENQSHAVFLAVHEAAERLRDEE